MGILSAGQSCRSCKSCNVFFKIHFTRTVERLCRGVLSVVYMECVKYMEQSCNIIFAEDRLDEIVMQSVIV
jgi:hypothetical protein